ncbi:MAG: LVIVD repeat-containing protein [Thermoleophilia bacterium]
MTTKRAIIASFIVSTCVFFIFSGTALAETICGVRPELSLKADRIQWASYYDYVNRILSVDHSISNVSSGDATGVTVIGARTSGGITSVTAMPMTIGTLVAGDSATFTMQYNIPMGVSNFRSRVLASVEDGCGNIYAYPPPAQQINLQIVAAVHDTTNLSGADGLYVDGNYAFIASGGSNSLSIIDISNPYAPVITSALTDPYGRLDRAWGVHVSGNFAYVVTGYSGTSDRLTVVDVSNRANPFIVGSLQDFINLDGALHIDVQGQYAYITAPFENRMTVVDISVPQGPRVVGSIRDDIRLYRADGISVNGTHAYVVSHQLDGGTDRSYLNSIDISDPAHPTIASSLNSLYFRGGDQMAIAGNYLYIPGNLDHTFSIVDISNPLSMNIVSHITSDAYIGQSCFVDVADKLAFMTSADNSRITVVDISDVTIPQIVGSLRDPINLSSALYVIAAGRFAYVTSPGGTFSVVEVTSTT